MLLSINDTAELLYCGTLFLWLCPATVINYNAQLIGNFMSHFNCGSIKQMIYLIILFNYYYICKVLDYNSECMSVTLHTDKENDPTILAQKLRLRPLFVY